MDINSKLKDYETCFNNSPLAFYVIKVIKDNKDNFKEFVFCYGNEALANLDGIKVTDIVGKHSHDIPTRVDKKYLDIYGNIAFNGGHETIVEYSKEIDKYISIECYQIEEGYCACLLENVSDMISVQNELKEEKQKYEMLLENMPGGVAIFEITDEIKIQYCSDWVYNFSGYSREEINSRPECDSFDDVYPDDLIMINQEVYKIIKGNNVIDINYRVLHKDGYYKYINLKAAVTQRSEDKIIMHGVYTDIDEKKKNEEIINAQNEEIKHIYNSIPGGVFSCKYDKDWTVISANDGFYRFVGYTKEEFKALFNNHMSGIIHEDDKKIMHSIISKQLLYGNCAKNENRLICKDGTIKWISIHAQLNEDDKDNKYFYCLFVDITKQKETEFKLRENEIKLKAQKQKIDTAIENADLYIWEYNVENHTSIQEGRVLDEFDLIKVEKNMPYGPVEKGIIHPQSVKDYIDMHNEIDCGATNVTRDIRLVGPDGGDDWQRMSYTTVFDDAGRPVRAIGCSKDITGEIIKEAQSQRVNMALSSTNLSMWTYNTRTHRFLEENTAVGEDKLQLCKRNLFTCKDIIEEGLIKPDSIDKYFSIHERLEQGEKTITEVIHFDKEKANGIEWQRVTYSNIFDYEGKTLLAVGVGEDISELMNAKKKISEEMEYQEAVQSDHLLLKGRVNVSNDKVESLSVNNDIDIFNNETSFNCCMDKLQHYVVTKKQKEEIKTRFRKEYIIEKYNEGIKQFSLEYQRRTISGDIIWVNTSYKTYENPETKDIMTFIYTYDINSEKIMKDMMNRVVGLDYDYMASIDIISDAYTIYTNENIDTPLPPFNTLGYEKEVMEYANKYVIEEDRQRNIDEMSYANIITQLDKNDTYTTYVGVMSDSGEIRQKKLQFSYMDRENQKILLTRTDVTDLHNREEAQKDILKDALLQAEQANVAKTDFLSRMSHEIRTPMNAIIGMSTLAAQCINDPSKVAECISKVGISARFLLSLINDILDMSRIESGKVTVKTEKIYFEEFINGINTICYEQASQKGIDYDCVITSFTDSIYYGDAMKIQQVLINIISNAIKFTPSGGKVQFMINQDKTENGKAYMRFTINDTGIGISDDFLPKLFDPFEQGDSNITSSYGGTGLGLAICQNLVNMMNGSISVNSIEGVGSEFCVQLKLEQCEESKREAKIKSELNFTKLSALIVDDEITICEHTKNILSDMGMKADWVDSGRKAIDIVKEKWNKDDYYNIILVDWKMPEMDGIETTRRIRKIVGPDVTIIIMTAYDWIAIEAEAKKAGVNMLIYKPLFKSSLSSTFEKIYFEKETEKQSKIKKEYDFTGKRVLLVEDHVLNIEVAKRLLNAKGFEVDIAENGLVAIESFVSNSENYYDAILMDIRMPLMDGLTATKSIRHTKKEYAKTVPIIAMSANAFDEDIDKSKAAGMNEHLAKPIEPEILYKTLDEYIND